MLLTGIAAAVLIGGGVLAEIIIHIKGPGGKETEIKVPDGSTVIVEKVPGGGTGTGVDDAWIKGSAHAGRPASRRGGRQAEGTQPRLRRQAHTHLEFGEIVGLELPADDLRTYRRCARLKSLKSLSNATATWQGAT